MRAGSRTKNESRHRCRLPLPPDPNPAPVRAWACPREVPAEAFRPRSVPWVPSEARRPLPVPSLHVRRDIAASSHIQHGAASKRVPMLSLRGSVDPKIPVFRRTYPRKWVRLAPRASSWLSPVPPASACFDPKVSAASAVAACSSDRSLPPGHSVTGEVTSWPRFPSRAKPIPASRPVDNGDIVDKAAPHGQAA